MGEFRLSQKKRTTIFSGATDGRKTGGANFCHGDGGVTYGGTWMTKIQVDSLRTNALVGYPWFSEKNPERKSVYLL